LRYRRFGGGYRREDVDLLLAEVRLSLRALELEVGTLRGRSHELEERLRAVDGFQAGGHELQRASAIVAEGAAEAERRIAAAEQRVEELSAERERLLGELRGLVSRVGEAIAGEDPEGTDRFLPAQNGHPGGDLGGLRERDSTRVELDAGPFSDFESAAGFERELAGLDDVEDVHLRYLNGHRAALELTVAAGAPLLAQMRERLPYELEVRDQSLDRLVIDVAEGP
jgi:hypothetical protein